MKKRMPAEWEKPRRILMAYPSEFTDWNYILPQARNQFNDILKALLKGEEYIILLSSESLPQSIRMELENNENVIIGDIPYNDTWTRDYGPITVEVNGNFEELDFGFNGWGLKFAADKDNLVNLRMMQQGYRNGMGCYSNQRDFILEGGSIETDGEGTLLTTSRCLCSPNRNGGKSKKELEAILSEKLGVSHFLWVDHGFLEGDDTDSHIDTLARMAPDNTIVYVAPPEDSDDIHHEELSKMENQIKGFLNRKGKPFRLVPLPFPDPVYDEDGLRLPATYANYLVTEWNLYMPVYGQPEKDREAVARIKEAFPNHMVYTVDCTTLLRQHGSLHCSTMQLYL